ncbi:MAG: glycosyltransferase, partial [Actinomycetota bacterium]|nr:glycosyltransferase [Actinomycetota bacterium]
MSPKEGDNPSGFWEPAELVAAHDRLLAELGSSWDDPCPLPSGWLESDAARRAQKHITELLEQEFGHARLFVLKDPRICRTVPLWTSALRGVGAEPGFVLVFRNPLEVASSLAARDGLSLERSLLLWLRHALDAELDTRAERRVFLSYRGLLADWRAAAHRVARTFALEWPVALEDAAGGVDGFLDAEQRHHTVADEDLAVRPDVVAWIEQVHGALAEAERTGDSVPGVVDAVRAELARADLAFAPVLREVSARAGQAEEKERQAEAKERELAGAQRKLAIVRSQLEKSERRQRELVDDERQANEALAQANESLAQASHEAREAEERAEALAAELTAVTRPRRLRWPRLPSWRTPLVLGSWFLPPSRSGLRKLRDYLGLRRARVFDAGYYLEHNPGIRLDPLMHYVNHGWLEQRDPNPWFSTSYYLSKHGDIAEARINPLLHYVRYGRREQRATRRPAGVDSPTFGLRSQTRAFTPKRVRAGIVTPGLLSSARERLTAAPLSVSVVLPTYNRASTVARAVRSALAQSYAPLEILVSDDGSTDGTHEVLEHEFGAELRDGRIRVIRKPHGGVSAARNAALAEARGDLVAYLDSDNEWEPDFLLLMADALGRHPEAGTAYAGLRVLGHPRGDFTRLSAFDRDTLFFGNFIDMNVFVHRRWVAEQLGAFDEELTRLVDWDLIVRYTRLYPPVLVPFVLATYNTGLAGDTISSRESLEKNRPRVLAKHRRELAWRGLEPVRIGYVLWDWPALSQTFVVDEIRRLLERGYDLKVYFRTDPDSAATIDFPVDVVRVSGPKELAEQVRRDERTILHSHFAYPTVTRLTFPAAVEAGIPFTFMPHAVDIFHYQNEARNRIDEITQHPLCQRVFVHGDFHRSYLIDRGVPAEKLTPTLQALPAWISGGDVSAAVDRRLGGRRRVVTAIARFIEKKGIEDLIRA